MRTVLPLLIALALVGCATPEKKVDLADIDTEGPVQQAVSLLGKPLYPMTLDPEVRDERMRNLVEAIAAFEADPQDVDAIIWLGRRYAYLGRYDLAIDTFTTGLERYPNSYRLLRHRGHRYITTRQFDLAIADLERAAAMSEGFADEIEPDGLPNRLNQPTSTDKTNIHYHLGLARYLTENYVGALEAYDKCLEFTDNPDMLVATVYWMYLTQQRAGQGEFASMILEPITPELEIIENEAYHKLLLLYKDLIGPGDVVGRAGDEIQSSTAAYGVAQWHAMEGNAELSKELLMRIVADPAWPAFGHIAAEADLSR
jgi:tetratricopeptide (TPR) repeat protein